MPLYSFPDQLAFYGIDRPPADAEMLLNFIERMAANRPVPSPAENLEELESRRPVLQARIRHSLGLDPWPERTPLNARKVGVLEKPGYRIEKLVYEAWAGLLVSAHLYIPESLKSPCPGLVYACGHWMESGKLAPPIQAFCATAATLGIMALVYDPIGQGERLQSWREHGHLAALLVGQSQLGLMVWESIRALDYLQSRPEVDPARIGMTGASGGGLNTFFTAAIEDRLACAIPVAYPCTFFAAMQAERDLNWEDGTDVCNQVPLVMSYAEMSDIASLFIPKPYMILSDTRDAIFPIAGTRQIASAIQQHYRLAEAPERFRFVEFDEEHGYQLSLRQAAYGWLKRWLLGEGDGSPVAEPELDLLPDPYPVEYSKPPAPAPGHVRDQSPTMTPTPGALPGFCFATPTTWDSELINQERIQAKGEEITDWLSTPSRPTDLPDWQARIRQRIQKVLGPFPEKLPLRTRLFNQVWENGMMGERITFQSEEGITIPGMLLLPEDWIRPIPCVIYAGEWGKMQGIRSGLVEKLVRGGYGVLAMDVRGVGETAATDFEAATNLLMMNRPLLGQRVFDLIRAVDFLWERCYIAPQIDKGRIAILGEGVGGLWSLFAAALDERVAGVLALDTLYSYKELLRKEPRYPASVYLFDVLRHFDIAHAAAACAPRPVFIRPVGCQRQPCAGPDVKGALQPAREAFAVSGVSPRWFQVATSVNPRSMTAWLDLVMA